MSNNFVNIFFFISPCATYVWILSLPRQKERRPRYQFYSHELWNWLTKFNLTSNHARSFPTFLFPRPLISLAVPPIHFCIVYTLRGLLFDSEPSKYFHYNMKKMIEESERWKRNIAIHTLRRWFICSHHLTFFHFADQQNYFYTQNQGRFIPSYQQNPRNSGYFGQAAQPRNPQPGSFQEQTLYVGATGGNTGQGGGQLPPDSSTSAYFPFQPYTVSHTFPSINSPNFLLLNRAIITLRKVKYSIHARKTLLELCDLYFLVLKEWGQLLFWFSSRRIL